MTQQTTIKIGPGFHEVLRLWVGEHLPSTAECLTFSETRSMITYPSGKVIEFTIHGEQVLVRLYSSSLEWKQNVKEIINGRINRHGSETPEAPREHRPVWFEDR